MEIARTPDERFEDLPDFPWEPHYAEWEGHRDVEPFTEGTGRLPF